MSSHNGTTLKKMSYNGEKVKKWYHDDVKVYSAGGVVTYYVDDGVIYQEEVDSEASCLSPKTFTPSKSGWSFVGWREDKTANGSVLSSKVMGDTPITLYAVFSADVTVTYYNNSTTASKDAKKKYYNNGNTANPTFKLAQAGVSGWSARGWSTGTAGNSGVTYNNNTDFTRDSNVTLYGTYSKSVTLSYNGNGSTGGSVSSHSGTAYRNYKSDVIGASFTLKANGYSRTYYNFNGWNLGAVGATVTLGDSTTAYAQWVVNTSSVPVSNFGYNGGVQTYIVPVTGLYKLEVWGGRPETFAMYDYDARYGGAGGYSVGYKELTAGTVLYIACGGGNGKTYNGGGELTHGDIRNGAGATHIALVNGTLASIGYDNFVTNKKGLIVAGGGGSGTMYGSWSFEGGSGGGLNGESISWYGDHAGGTQTSGYAFGQGGPGAGGGLFGGHGGTSCAGGSGYIGGVPAITYKGTSYSPQTTNGVNSGDGRATITLVAA